jgi:hypothetical protein
VVGQLAELLDWLAVLGCDPAIQPLLRRAADDYRLAFAGIAATFALQQALPAVRNGDQASLDDGLREYQ